MLCPYCLSNTSPRAKKCVHCDEELPPLYLQGYQRLRQPVVLSAVGFSGHGKTVYLAALLHVLENRLTRIWPGFFRQGLDMNAINTVKSNLQMLDQGTLPESTRRNFPRPSLHLLSRMPKFKERQVIIYDPPGEAFEEDLRVEKFASFVTRAKTVLFLVSLIDLEEPLASDLNRLLEVYTLGMNRLKAKTRNQHLVVVFTKADLLLEERFFGKLPDVLAYLQRSEQNEIGNIKSYLEGMKTISEKLAGFTKTDLKAHNFINLAQNQFKSVSYCAISSLGSPPENGKLSETMQPRRVVDPLLWVLDKS